MIITTPQIEKPYQLDNESIRGFLKNLKQAQKEIEKYDWTFEKVGLCDSEFKKKVLDEIKEQIKLCEHYFTTKKRKDLFKWIFQEKYKPNDWNEERDSYTFSNGKVKAVIEVFKNPSSTKIIHRVESDCDLFLSFRKDETYKNLRSEESIKKYLDEIKKYLEEELKKATYDKGEINFYNFVLLESEND